MGWAKAQELSKLLMFLSKLLMLLSKLLTIQKVYFKKENKNKINK
jgi:hypothetical protein